MQISIVRATPALSLDLAIMTGELLNEIMDAIKVSAFQFELHAAESRLRQFIEEEKYFVLAALEQKESGHPIGFIAMYESYSLYAQGTFGTIPELYVKPAHRCSGVGRVLLASAKAFGAGRGWTRLEVTTPPLPAFQKTLDFYEREGFSISGGRKLQTGLRT